MASSLNSRTFNIKCFTHKFIKKKKNDEERIRSNFFIFLNKKKLR
jgi:hypothetical protein